MEFRSVSELVAHLVGLGAERVYCKLLAENDNSKQQIYLGKSFDVLKLIKYGEVTSSSEGTRPNFKAPVPLVWITPDGHKSTAPGAQLILYPDYPEVRLSGFLRGSPCAPTKDLQPTSKELRCFNNQKDGRVLFFGITNELVLTYLATANTSLALEITINPPPQANLDSDVLLEIPVFSLNKRELVISHLREIILASDPWHPSIRLDKKGFRKPYLAKNGGGYTLEALLGIIPNGRSEPDFLGWEIKSYSQPRVTLMTPEPDGGFYGINGAEAFLRRYGRRVRGDTLYFTGSHYVGTPSATSGHVLEIIGFDKTKAKIVDVTGGIRLIDKSGIISAEWTFAKLIEKWGRKHASAAYIGFENSVSASAPRKFRYKNPILMGEGTDFPMFLLALAEQAIVYDPAPKLEFADGANSKVKARSQFRITISQLHRLYKKFAPVTI